ncbi:hypothetical protein PTKIN_Ptkin11bG0128800 [Pterospermum kingtungense]
METNEERIENLKVTLRKLQDNLCRVELVVNNKLHRLETTINKISEVMLAKQEYPMINHVHDDRRQSLNGQACEFYDKVDDDVHVNLGMVATTLGHHRSKPRDYTGQIYANSKDQATYISINQLILHKYANEYVAFGSWFIGLEVVAGKPLDHAYLNESVSFFEAGCVNLARHIKITKAYGVNVVDVEKFSTNIETQLNVVRNMALAAGAFDVIICTYHVHHGRGTVDLRAAVQRACETAIQPSKLLCPLDISIKEKIKAIVRSCGANIGVEFIEHTEKQIEVYNKQWLPDRYNEWNYSKFNIGKLNAYGSSNSKQWRGYGSLIWTLRTRSK